MHASPANHTYILNFLYILFLSLHGFIWIFFFFWFYWNQLSSYLSKKILVTNSLHFHSSEICLYFSSSVNIIIIIIIKGVLDTSPIYGTGGGFPHSNKQFLDTNGVSYSSIQFWHYISGDSVRSHILRVQSSKTPHIPNFKCRLASRGYHLGFWQTGYQLEVPMTTFFLWFNLLEQLTDLLRSILLVYYKRTEVKNSWMEEMRRAGYVGGDTKLPCPLPGVPLSQHLHLFTTWELPKPLPALLGVLVFVFFF